MKSPLLLLVFSFISTLFYGQVSVTATAGTATGRVPPIKRAFDAINAVTHQCFSSLHFKETSFKSNFLLLKKTTSAELVINNKSWSQYLNEKL